MRFSSPRLTPHFTSTLATFGGIASRAAPSENEDGVTFTTGIIAVTEDPFIRKFLGDVLKRRGYRVVGADSAHTIEMIRSGNERVDLVITNTPVEFASVADQVPMLYIAAVPDPDVGSRFPSFRALKKPFLPDQLFAAVKELVGAL